MAECNHKGCILQLLNQSIKPDIFNAQLLRVYRIVRDSRFNRDVQPFFLLLFEWICLSCYSFQQFYKQTECSGLEFELNIPVSHNLRRNSQRDLDFCVIQETSFPLVKLKLLQKFESLDSKEWNGGVAS